jgi:hypothetical protein
MSTLFPKPITVIRKDPGTFSDLGRYQEGVTNEIIIYGSVQPDTGKDNQAQEVGLEDLGKVKCYMNEPLQVSSEGNNIVGDRVIYQNKEWEVLRDLPYQNDLIPHYKYIAEYRREYTP